MGRAFLLNFITNLRVGETQACLHYNRKKTYERESLKRRRRKVQLGGIQRL